jgi:phage/plasmid-associated DNA primase
VTGGENLSAAFKGGRVFDFKPEFKLLVTSNDPPSLRSVGPEMRRRFHVYAFTRSVSNPDTHLRQRLQEEAGAILRWMIEGAVAYYRQGLFRSPVVEAANDEYFLDNDPVQQWLDERTEKGEGFRVESAEAYSDFVAWSEAAGSRHPMTRPTFTKRLRAKGIENTTGVVERGANPVRIYSGIRLIAGFGSQF